MEQANSNRTVEDILSLIREAYTNCRIVLNSVLSVGNISCGDMDNIKVAVQAAEIAMYSPKGTIANRDLELVYQAIVAAGSIAAATWLRLKST